MISQPDKLLYIFIYITFMCVCARRPRRPVNLPMHALAIFALQNLYERRATTMATFQK